MDDERIDSTSSTATSAYPHTKDIEIPDALVEKWQHLLDTTATVYDVPAGLIMRIDPPYIEVFQASENPENPYAVGARETLSGLYCEEVVVSRTRLHVPDAQQSERWRDNLDVEEFGLVAYLGYPIEFPDGDIFGTICVLDQQEREFADIYQDLLEQFRDMVEADLQILMQHRELEIQNERLQKFASMVSHDLRNPLSVASGRLELAQQECDSDQLPIVARAHGRMNAMIEDLLMLARQTYGGIECEPLVLREIAETCWQNVAVNDATLRVETDQTVQADAIRLAQLFENLYRNAIEHGGSDVQVEMGPLADGFYIEDDGPGIPEDERDRVFEPGYTQSADGTGFGLSIVTDVVEAHGWAMELHESADGGARFEFRGVMGENSESSGRAAPK